MAFKMKGFIPQGNQAMGNMGRNMIAAKAKSAARMGTPMTKKSTYDKDKPYGGGTKENPKYSGSSENREEQHMDYGKNLDVGAGLKAGKGFTDRLKNRGVKSAVSNAAPVRYGRTVVNTLGPEFKEAGKTIAKGVKNKAKKVGGYLANLKNKAKEKLSSAMTKKEAQAIARKSKKLGAGTSSRRKPLSPKSPMNKDGFVKRLKEKGIKSAIKGSLPVRAGGVLAGEFRSLPKDIKKQSKK